MFQLLLAILDLGILGVSKSTIHGVPLLSPHTDYVLRLSTYVYMAVL